MGNVWWLAIDVNEGHASFEELKERRVIAQGWSALGDMTRFLDENSAAERPEVISKIASLLRHAYPDADFSKLPNNLYNFFFGVQPGDLVIGIEGYEVRGICELPEGSAYFYEPKTRDGHEQDYSHARGPVTWIEWETFSPDWKPAVARQTIAVANLRDQRDEVIRLFDGWRETEHLLSSPANAERLVRSIRQGEIAEASSRTLAGIQG